MDRAPPRPTPNAPSPPVAKPAGGTNGIPAPWPGDLLITGNTLHVRLDPASAPRRSKARAHSTKGHPTHEAEASLCLEFWPPARRTDQKVTARDVRPARGGRHA